MTFSHLLTIIGSAVFMVFFFGLCVFVHELGHFLVAKWRGFHVIAFSIGFKKAWGFHYKGVEYRIGWIPFGGYVEIPQIDATGEAKDENGNVLPKGKPFDRILAVVAGPLFNILFGFLVACVIWYCGIPKDSPTLKTIEVAAIEKNSPEYNAGLREGDIITKINGKDVNYTWNDFIVEILVTIGDVKLEVQRGDKTFVISYKPIVNRKVSPADEIAYPFFMPKLPLKLYPVEGSPAAKAGVKANDEIVSVNGRKVSDMLEFEQLTTMSSAPSIDMVVKRDGKLVEIKNIVPNPIEIDGKKGVYLLGITFRPTDPLPKVIGLAKGMPAEKNGMKLGDEIVEINGTKLTAATDCQKFVNESDGGVLHLKIRRDGKLLDLSFAPEFLRYNDVGIEYAYLAHPTPWEQFMHVIDMSVKSLRSLGVSLGNKLGLTEQHTTIQAKHLSGPIGIGRVLYISVYKGSLIQGLNLVVLITFSLGLFNLLPIPVLDGGHVVLAFLEILFRRPMSPKVLQPVTMAFVALLVAFMLFVSFYDVKRVIASFSAPGVSRATLEKSIKEANAAEEKTAEKNPDELSHSKNKTN